MTRPSDSATPPAGAPATDGPELSPVKQALLKIKQLQAKIAVYEKAEREPLAIVGMACRFPGGASTPDAFWKLLDEGVDAISEIPKDRWDHSAWYDPDPDVPGRMYVRHGGFIDDVDRFDSQFFSIAPREAATMDPQQRLLLEVSWEALEDAGMRPEKLYGSPTGVFVGLSAYDYAKLLLGRSGIDALDTYSSTGNALSVAAGRLSYVLGLQGPCLALDTACSSSLVSLHLACQSLRRGECDLALAGGVNLMLAPETTTAIAKARMLSFDGRCKTFDALADGYVRGEGCGMLALKRLSDAERDGDRILALIRGTAVNQDGASGGLTVPSGPSQQDVIAKALADAGVEPSQVSYVEAHGTGTSLGDPIEVEALGEVFRDRSEPLMLGSVKTNFGHLESAAGIAGVMKVILALRHRRIPPHLHLHEPNPYIGWDALRVEVPTEGREWSVDGPRIAGVSSFGYSGTNSHIILEEAPAPAAIEADRPARERDVLVLSAKSEDALRELAGRWTSVLSAPNASLGDLCTTAAIGRARFNYRLSAVASSAAEAAEKLATYQGGKTPAGLTTDVAPSERPKIAFVFTGQGSQWIGMGKGLYESEPVFRDVIDRCEAALEGRLERPLREVLWDDDSPLDDTLYTQPAIFAIGVALFELWKSWGLAPDAVAGHSVGEYAAACAAGVFSIEDGARLIAERARLMHGAPGDGAMINVFAEETTVLEALQGHEDQVALGVYNGKSSLVVSGARAGVEAVQAKLEADGVKVRALNVSHAFHSPLMEPILGDFERAAEQADFTAPRIALVSNVSADVAGDEVATARYWRDHIRSPVRFAASVEKLADLGCEIFVELGPTPNLTSMGRRILPREKAAWLPCLRKGRVDADVLLGTVGELFTRGVDVDWDAFAEGRGSRRTAAPTYPYQRRTYWIDKKLSDREVTAASAGGAAVDHGHPLLGRRLHLPGTGQVRFDALYTVDRPAYCRDHRILNEYLVPGASHTTMVLQAAPEILGTSACAVRNVLFARPFVLREDGARRAQLVAAPAGDEWDVRLLSAEEGREDDVEWTEHATFRLAPSVESPFVVDFDAARTRCTEELPGSVFYKTFWDAGYELGPSFRWIDTWWRGDDETVCLMKAPEELAEAAESFRIHPTLLDASFQILVAADSEKLVGEDFLVVPFHIKEVVLHRPVLPGEELWCLARVTRREDDASGLTGDIDLCSVDGRAVVSVRGFEVRRARHADLRKALVGSLDDLLYTVEWRSQPQRGVVSPVLDSAATADRLEAQVDALSEEVGLSGYFDFLARVEELSAAYAVEAFEALGWTMESEDSWNIDELAIKLGVIDPHRRLLGRLLAMLAEDGVLHRDGDQWTVLETPTPRRARDQWEELLDLYPPGEAELELVGRCGAALADVLRGEAGALDLLFPNGDSSTAARYYRDSPGSRLMNTLMRDAVREALSELAPRHRARLLEVGAGTGGTTAHLLDALPEGQVDYVFTDVGGMFVAQARERFSAEYPFMSFQTLDVESDPTEQGLEAGSCDLVSASNVLHATQDLGVTLRNVRKLLADDGLILIFENIGRQRWVDLVFGLTEGWWRYQDTDRRPDYPLMSLDSWRETLEECGFTDVRPLPGADAEGMDERFRQAVLIARAAPAPQREESRRWMIFADRGGVGQRLSEMFSTRGDTCRLIFPGDAYEEVDALETRVHPGRRGDFEQLFTDVENLAGVIDLWGLDEDDLDRALERGTRGALHLVQALAASGSSARLWLGIDGLEQSPLWGFAKGVALEHPRLRCAAVEVGGADALASARRLYDEIQSDGDEDQIRLVDDERRVARLERLDLASDPRADLRPDHAYRLDVTDRGTLDTLMLLPIDRGAPGPGEVAVAVRATGLNFRDVLNALGEYPGDPGPLGIECSGLISAVGEGVDDFEVGDPVVGIGFGTFTDHLLTDARLMVKKPDNLSFEEAATIPVVFLTVIYALDRKARLGAGEKVLIHAATGGVGQAAVQWAQRVGAEIWGSASLGKWDVLRGLGVENIVNSRTLDFAQEILDATDGGGVDVLLNCLSGEFIDRSFDVLADAGRFAEIGKRGIWTSEQARSVKPRAQYDAIDLVQISHEEPALIREMLTELMDLFAAGDLQPIPHRTWPIAEAEDAFRFMQKARHIGKLIVAHAPAVGTASFRKDASYLITGGLGGLGLRVAEWMAQRGAGRLILVGRRGTLDAAGEEAFEAIRDAGAEVVIAKADVSVREEIARVVAGTPADLPLRGVVHAAGVLDDGLLDQQDWTSFRRVLGPKVDGAQHLHELTEHLPLDLFVLFSSTASLVGNAGQANHSAANAFLDALAHERVAAGLPGLSIHWGGWAQIGAVARRGVAESLGKKGIGTITPEQGLALLEAALEQSNPQVGAASIDWRKFSARYPDGKIPPYYSEVASGSAAAVPGAALAVSTSSSGEAAASASTESVVEVPILERLEGTTGDERRELLIAYLQERMTKVLGFGPSHVPDPHAVLNELGLDSLMGMELRNWLSTDLGVDLPLEVLIDRSTVAGLADQLAERLAWSALTADDEAGADDDEFEEETF